VVVQTSAEQLESERRRNDELRDRLAEEQTKRAVGVNELKHAGTRTAAQQMLQILGGAFVGWGLSELKTTNVGWVFVVLGTVMAAVGCLPTIRLPWSKL